MKTLSVYRAEACMALRGSWFGAALLFFVATLIGGLFNVGLTICFGSDAVMSNATSLVGSLLFVPIAYGVCFAFLGQARQREMQIGDLFCGYNKRVWSTMILWYVYLILWTLLLIIPGIIKSYSYSMTCYIMADDPDISGNAAIEKSMAMMSGHKWRLFLLDLTFIGWYILGVLCFFVGVFWAEAYRQQARVMFYETLKQEENEIQLNQITEN